MKKRPRPVVEHSCSSAGFVLLAPLRPGVYLPERAFPTPLVKTSRNRRKQNRDDAASRARAEQRGAERSLQRLLLTILIGMLALASIGYALSIWWG